MLDNILRQQDQAGDFIKVMSEYSTTVNNNGALLVSLMRNMSMFFAAAEAKLGGFRSQPQQDSPRSSKRLEICCSTRT